MLRREGLYDSHVKEWRAAIKAGTLSEAGRRTRGKKSVEQKKIAELEKQVKTLQAQNAKKDQVIADREAALEVLGKGVEFLEALSRKEKR